MDSVNVLTMFNNKNKSHFKQWRQQEFDTSESGTFHMFSCRLLTSQAASFVSFKCLGLIMI